MCGHLALTRTAHAIPFFSLGKDHGGLAGMIGRSRIGSMDFDQVVTTTFELIDLFVGHSLREARELFILPKKIVAIKAPVFGGKGLHLSINSIGKGACQCTRQIACKQTIPVAPPD